MAKVTFDDFSDDVEKDLISCPSCNIELFMLEHSGFEDSYYLYCDSCPLRVDISIYDKKYEEIEGQLKGKIKDPDERDDFLDILLSEIERYIQPCKCGGKFKSSSPRRCLNCGKTLDGYENYMNVWYLQHFSEECDDEEISKYIISPDWL